LALTQAAGVLAETGMPAGEYQAELDRHALRVMGAGVSSGYGRSLAAAVTVAVDRLSDVDPGAAQLLRVCAFLAPEPVPTEWRGNPAHRGRDSSTTVRSSR